MFVFGNFPSLIGLICVFLPLFCWSSAHVSVLEGSNPRRRMAKKDGKRKHTNSDPGQRELSEDVVSSDGSVGSSPAKLPDVCPDKNLDYRLLSPVKGGNPLSFADLFKETSKPSTKAACTFIRPNEADVLEIDQDDVDKVNDLWGFCLLGCYAGRFLGLKAIHTLVNTWKTERAVLPHHSGWVIFQFQKKEELERILAGGPYFIYKRTLLLRTLPKDICFQEEDYSVVPIWVQLPSLPPQCLNTRAIRKIASTIGKPICVDNITLERKRISYARVLIEVDTSVEPIEAFEVKLPSGITYKQYAYYENLPKFCNFYYMFGRLR